MPITTDLRHKIRVCFDWTSNGTRSARKVSACFTSQITNLYSKWMIAPRCRRCMRAKRSQVAVIYVHRKVRNTGLVFVSFEILVLIHSLGNCTHNWVLSRWMSGLLVKTPIRHLILVPLSFFIGAYSAVPWTALTADPKRRIWALTHNQKH